MTVKLCEYESGHNMGLSEAAALAGVSMDRVKRFWHDSEYWYAEIN